MNPFLDQLAEYTEVLGASADATNRAEDRTSYEKHLAQAARMFVAAHRRPGGPELRRLIEAERRNYGWSFLSGDEGNRTEVAFNAFADFVARGL